MKRWMTRLGVVLVVLSLAGMLYAPPGGRARRVGPGRGLPKERTQTEDTGYLEGVIQSVKTADTGEVLSIVVAGKKTKDGKNGPVVTLTVTFDTQVFIGQNPARTTDLAEGKNVIAGCKKAADGTAPIIVLIRILDAKDAAKPAEDKPAEAPPAEAPKDAD